MIHACNASPFAFSGWLRIVTDAPPAFPVGKTEDGTLWVYVGEFAEGLHEVDINISLDAGERRSFLLKGEKVDWVQPPLPDDLIQSMGGVPQISGVPMAWIEGGPSGAGWKAHFRARLGSLLVVDFWVRWYPDTPAIAFGEVVVAASNPAVPESTLQLPAGFALRIHWGTADVVMPLPPQGELLPAQEHLIDGQARSLPVTIFWRDQAQDLSEMHSATAHAMRKVVAHGVTHAWPQGSSKTPESSSAKAASDHAASVQAIRSWQSGPLGVTARSGQTGAQEDQMWPGAEVSSGVDGLLEVEARYLTALRQSLRPCHHLEADGSHLRLEEHPQLVLWDGRPHWHRGVSPDRLGKMRDPSEAELRGWWGPDVEHALCQTLTMAARMTGSDALQWQLEHWARIYERQWTVEPGYSTSQPYAARAVGYEGILTANLISALRNRKTASAVRHHAQQRLDAVLVPQLGSKWNQIWDVRLDDGRLGPGPWWIPWQQGLGVYGLWLMASTLDHDAARSVAVDGALRVVTDAWVLQEGRWVGKPQMPATDPTGGVPDASFNLFGMNLAPYVVLQADPAHEKASAIWQQLMNDTNGGRHPWMPPSMD